MSSTDPGIDESVELVRVMFKCHLDVGFTDTEAAVLSQYAEVHLPRAIEISDQLRAESDDRYVWTVPAWLLYRYLHQAGPAARARAEGAIGRGDLVWHALPFTWYTELLDRSSVAASLGFSRWLDTRFDTTTTAARMTDVPGHTRGLIGPLADAGVTFLDIGVNPGCRAPQVPFAPGVGLAESAADQPDPDLVRWHDAEPVHADRGTPAAERRRLTIEGLNSARTHLFRWRDPEGQEITVLYHPRSYGSTVALPGVPAVVSMRVHGDNLGPHSIESVRSTYASLRRKFPRAEVVGSSLSQIAALVEPLAPSLPVLTREIGDTWIYGTGSDPAKTGALREVLRLRQEWLAGGLLSAGDDVDLGLLAELVPAPEHNWGLSTSVYLRSWTGYRTDELARARREEPMYATNDAEWTAQRARPYDAVRTLPAPLREQAQARLAGLAEPPPAAGSGEADGVLDNGLVRLEISPTTGGLAALTDRRNGRQWAAADGLAVFSYQGFDVADYQRYAARYNHAAFTANDFGKPGLADYPVSPLLWTAAAAHTSSIPGEPLVTVSELQRPAAAADDSGLTAWPDRVVLRYALVPDEAAVDLTCWVVGKPANRRPEALWLSFSALADRADGWRLDKLGQAVDPHDVVDGGGRYLHGVGRGVSYRDARGGLVLQTLDAHLVSPGGRGLLRFDDELLDLRGGMHLNLYNNLWGTAFPQWYELDMRFRLRISLQTPEERSPW